MISPRALLEALRPKQWLKNVLVFAAPVGAGVVLSSPALGETLATFGLFVAASGAGYLVNDLWDLDSDRRHPTKCRRPIASGRVPVGLAVTLAVVLGVGAVAGAWLVRPTLTWCLAAYLASTISYTVVFKHLAVVDLVSISAGFVLRAVAGAVATDVPISSWFFVVTSFGALMVVTGKRLGELNQLAEDAGAIRKTLGMYTTEFLTSVITMSMGVMLVGYCLWAFASATAAQSPEGRLVFEVSIAPFAVTVMRFAQRLLAGAGAEPETLIYRDHVLLLSGLLWAVVYGSGVVLG